MKKYEYVSVKIGRLFRAGSLEHREIIDDYAARGYRYAGYIPTEMDSYGRIMVIDLIFEMDL